MVFSVAAMPAVHQPVQNRAEKQQQEGQETEKMGPVLSDQEESGNGEEPDQDQACPRPEPAPYL